MTADDLELRRSDEELAERRNYIGGSDANILMSGDQQKIRNLWLEKIGQQAPVDLSAVLPVAMGLMTEPLNVHWYQMDRGRPVTDRKSLHHHPVHDFMRCEVDGFTQTDEAQPCVFEAKHVNAWSDVEDVTQVYMPQVHHNMACTGLGWAVQSIFVGTTTWRYFEVELDEFYLAQLMDNELAFWEAVQTKQPPPYLQTVETPLYSGRLRVVDMTHSNSWAQLAADWLANKEPAKTFEDAKKELKKLIDPDVGLATGHGIKVKRARDGSLRIRPDEGKQQRGRRRSTGGITV